MNEIKSIGFALDPANIPSFLLDWEITKLCNLDCSYCTSGPYGGHDNTTQHPPLADCLSSIDFMYRYVDLYMKNKRPNQRKVVLNVYGGESLFHPDIVEILNQVKEKYIPYKDSWNLTVTCTTNAVVGPNHWKKIVPLVDRFTLSYHSEAQPKQKELFKDNVLYLKDQNKSFRTVVMMHNNSAYWDDCIALIDFLKEHNIEFDAKPLDETEQEWNYTPDQFGKLKTFWIKQAPVSKQDGYSKMLEKINTDTCVSSASEGRACCGGRKLSVNNNLKSNMTFVPKQGFRDWYCSVNWFFLFVQQYTGNVFVNKDCQTNPNSNRVEPIGKLSESSAILTQLESQFTNKEIPVIRCVKDTCLCGFCAPKAETKDDFLNLLRYNITSIDIVKDA